MHALESSSPLPSPAWGRRRTAWACAAAFALGAALYARALGYPFLNWDDPVYVVGNEWIRGFAGPQLRAIFTNGIQGGWLPVHLLSYSFDHALWGLDPRGYHLHSLLLNAANGALALWVLLRLSQRPAAALLAALFFVVHPTHVSSAVWVSARKELLFTFFLLLSTAAYLRARRGGGLERRAYAASLALFALGALSKATISLYPLFFVLVDLAVDARLAPERRCALRFHVATKLPFLAIGAAVVLVNFTTQVVAEDPYTRSLFTYALVKGQAAWRYLWLLVGLLPGQPIYDAPPIQRAPLVAAATLAPLVALPGLFVWAWRRGHREAGLALAWLGLGMVPPLAFPLVTFMADRYLYAPSLGFCWLLGLGIDAAAARMRGRAWRAGLVALLAGLVVARLLPLGWRYQEVWSSSEALWSYAMRHAVDLRARAGLSSALIEQERFEEARDLLTGVALDVMGLANRGAANFRLGRLQEALADADAALRLAPEQGVDPPVVATVHALRGRVLWKLGREDEALEAWREALRVDPANDDARKLLDAMPRARDAHPPVPHDPFFPDPLAP